MSVDNYDSKFSIRRMILFFLERFMRVVNPFTFEGILRSLLTKNDLESKPLTDRIKPLEILYSKWSARNSNVSGGCLATQRCDFFATKSAI